MTTDAQGYKSVAYQNAIPVLVEAIKDQENIMEQQQAAIERETKEKNTEIQNLKQSVSELKAAVSRLAQSKSSSE